MELPGPFLYIPLDPVHMSNLREQGIAHLTNNGIEVFIEPFKMNDSSDVFCIILRCGNEELLFNDGGDDNDVLVWDTNEAAQNDLDEYILPNIALSIAKHNVKLFHMNLGELF